ncbi:piggyBac transposable element-derived protein 4-like [Ischnura elegans]|uniref:piggyBac transposable element-derived protein 4-like n=1 Tax=Ischnura elegans TaxID=197161 RepID=UPI001ED8B3B0|nr:piggyBac transposable element-derived protein 4-like [Ischnura elegans]
MAGQKILSQDDIQKLLNVEGTSEDDMDYQSIEEESSSEGDNESAASEVSDYDSENFSDTEATAESERTISFLGKDGTVWNSQPFPVGGARAHNIIKGQTHKIVLPPGKILVSPIDAFSLFVDDSLVEDIVKFTNMEAERVNSSKKLKIAWKPCDCIEIRAFFGLLLTAGYLRSNHTSYDVLWSQLYGPPIFRATMGLKRFKYLLAFILFDDKAKRSVRPQKDKFAPIREVWEKLNTNFKKHYLPGSNITVDEQLIPYRGKCPFKQYMPSKPDKYGMKVWWACDSETFYPLNSLPYLGKEGGERALPGLGRRVVQQITEPY